MINLIVVAASIGAGIGGLFLGRWMRRLRHRRDEGHRISLRFEKVSAWRKTLDPMVEASARGELNEHETRVLKANLKRWNAEVDDVIADADRWSASR